MFGLFGKKSAGSAAVDTSAAADPAAEGRAAAFLDEFAAAAGGGRLVEMFGGGLVNLPPVSRADALGVTPFSCGAGFLTRTMACLPLAVYVRGSGDDREKLRDDPAHPLLTWAANDEMSALDALRAFWWDYFTKSRAMLYIERNDAGHPVNLWPLDVDAVRLVRRADQSVFYKYTPTGAKSAEYAPGDVIDLSYIPRGRDLSAPSLVAQNKPAFQIAVAVQSYAGKFFAGGGVPMWGLYQKESMSPDAMARAVAEMRLAQKKAQDEGSNSVVLGPGWDLKQLGTDPEKSQMLAVQRFVIEEMARILSMPPVFLADLTKGTFANVEQQDMHLVKHCVAQHSAIFQAEAGFKLFGRRPLGRYVEHNLDGLLRGDLKGRAEAHALMIQNGILTPDEVRRLNNRAALPGGNRLYLQGAMVPASRAGDAFGADNNNGGSDDT